MGKSEKPLGNESLGTWSSRIRHTGSWILNSPLFILNRERAAQEANARAAYLKSWRDPLAAAGQDWLEEVTVYDSEEPRPAEPIPPAEAIVPGFAREMDELAADINAGRYDPSLAPFDRARFNSHFAKTEGQIALAAAELTIHIAELTAHPDDAALLAHRARAASDDPLERLGAVGSDF